MGERRTVIAVLASHDSVRKNNELARLFEELTGKGENRDRLKEFHFLFTGGYFQAYSA